MMNNELERRLEEIEERLFELDGRLDKYDEIERLINEKDAIKEELSLVHDDLTILQQKEYIRFVLGADLLRDRFTEDIATDEWFDECDKIANDFLTSEEYLDLSMSLYDALETYLKRMGGTK